MKTIFFCLCFVFGAQMMQAQDHWLYWKYKDYDGAISVTAPGWAIHVGSWFVENKEDRHLMRKVNKVRALVFDGKSPVTESDMKKFANKARRKGLEEILFVREGKTRIRVMAKERKGALRKVVVFVQSPDEFVLVSVKGKLRFDEVNRILTKYKNENSKESSKPVIPQVLKVPVSRV